MGDGAGYVSVGKFSSLREKRGVKVIVGGEEIALWRVGGKVYAIDNVCSHQHIPAMHQGRLEGLAVACPMHGWTYSLETGLPLFGNGRIRTFSVKVEGDDVYVEVPRPRW
jgi:nitrite reductase/ring-hydroxylating ferredoxin subunit